MTILGQLLIFIQVYGQSDSLVVTSNQSIKDEKWIDAMNFQLERTNHNNLALALTYSIQIVSRAKALDYTEGLIKAELNQAYFLFKLGRYPEATTLIKQVIDYNAFTNNEQLVFALVLLGNVYFDSSKYDSSLIAYNRAEDLLSGINKDIELADVYNNQANVYSLKGNYVGAIEKYTQAAAIYQSQNKPILLAVTYNNMGSELYNQQNYPKSIEYYLLAVEINRSSNNLLDLAQNYSNIGASYRAMDSISQAFGYYQKSLEIAKTVDNAHILAQNYVNIANIYEKQGDYIRALEFFQQSLSYCKRSNIGFGLVINYMNMGNVYFLMEKYQNAITMLDSALFQTISLGLVREKAQVYERYVRVYKAMGKFEEALNFQMLFSLINDSLISVAKLKQIADIQVKYETSQKELLIKELEQKNTNNKLSLFYLLFISMVLLVIVVVVFYKRKLTLKEKIIAEAKVNELIIKIRNKDLELFQKDLSMEELNEKNKHNLQKLQTIVNKPNNEQEALLAELLRNMSHSFNSKKSWKDFEVKFSKIHPGFYTEVLAKFPDLTPNELRIIALLQLNLSSKEIAELTQRSYKTIENVRGNIRKKMNLASDQNLLLTILKLGNHRK